MTFQVQNQINLCVLFWYYFTVTIVSGFIRKYPLLSQSTLIKLKASRLASVEDNFKRQRRNNTGVDDDDDDDVED